MLQQPTAHETQSEKEGKQTGWENFRSPGGQRVIGTASAKPYTVAKTDGKEPTDGVHLLFKRVPAPQTDVDDGTPQWECLSMVIDPTLQGRGLATQLMNLTVDEIKRRGGSGLRDPSATRDMSEAKASDGTNDEKKKELMLPLSTMKDLNEGYYAKRGWTATATKEFPKGTRGSRDGFRIVEMFKRVEL